MLAAILPWPERSVRRARVDAARRGAEQARRKAEEASEVKSDLYRILRENHIAQAIVEDIIKSHGQGRVR